MNEIKTQNQRLDYLVEEFKRDSVQYIDLETPKDTEGKRRILRSLMNIRMPGKMNEAVLAVQDDYMRERIRENGIVEPADIPVIRDQISIWQGDITRLAADAIVNAANSQMLGCFVPMHTCIDNCIHTFAGVQLREECYRQMKTLRIRYGRAYEQPTAVPMLTDAYNLPAKKVVHIVGPVVRYGLTKELEDQKVLFLEAAVGMNTPGIIKFQFWKIVNQWPDATYACLNYGEAYAPDEIIDRSICINGDIREILMKL